MGHTIKINYTSIVDTQACLIIAKLTISDSSVYNCVTTYLTIQWFQVYEGEGKSNGFLDALMCGGANMVAHRHREVNRF